MTSETNNFSRRRNSSETNIHDDLQQVKLLPLNPEENHFQDCQPPREIRKTLFVCVCAFLAVLLNHMALAIVSDITSRDALPDLGHSLVPQTEIALHLTDSMALVGSLSNFFIIALFHKYRFVVIRRLLYIGTVLYLMRAVSIVITHIPPSFSNNHEVCIKPSQEENPTVWDIFNRFMHISFTFGLQVKNDKGKLHCGDMLFSGHTTAVSLSCFFLNHYTPRSLWPLRITLIACCLVAILCAIFSRAHYSVDVVMGYWISSIIFSLYHAYTYVPHRQRAMHRPFRRLLIFWTMYEIEKKVPPGRVPNHLEWPLPWPKSIHARFDEWNSLDVRTRVGRTAHYLATYRLNLHF